MHIPDGFLSAGVAAATWGLTGAGLSVSLRAERRDTNPAPAGLIGSVAAFLFAAQMVNLPVAPGSSGHLLGATLASVLLGPWRATIAMAVVLAVQAVLFQDGGITALGANVFDMGLVASFTSYGLVAVIAGRRWTQRRIVGGAVVAAFTATLASATFTTVWLAVSGLYPLTGLLPVMLVAHTAIGVLEAALTGAVLVSVLRWRPDLIRDLDGDGASLAWPAAASAGILAVAFVVAAFVAPFASPLPDGLETAARRLGFEANARPVWSAPWSRRSEAWDVAAGVVTSAAGLAGTALTALTAWVLSRRLPAGRDEVHR